MDNYRDRNSRAFSLFISFPTIVENVVAQEFYDWVSYIAELSGWVGLCLGLSVPGVFAIILSKIKYRIISESFRKWSPYIAFGLIILFLRQACVCVDKLQNRPTVTHIAIDNPGTYLKEIAISICMSKQLYGYEPINGEYFLGNKASFWNTYSNISSMISDAALVQNLKSKLIWNSTTKGDSFELNYFPSDDGHSIDFCHTLSIPKFHTFKQLQFTVTDDVFFYIHHTGQLIENAFSSRRDALHFKKTLRNCL